MDLSGKTFLFCGCGGSGMSALALYAAARGATVYGSDRNHDRGLYPDYFNALSERGVRLIPQDGTGVKPAMTAVVVSSAVEPTIPDVAAAQKQGVPILRRAEMLASLVNDAHPSVTVGGTSGKSTVTAMIGWVASQSEPDVTVLNGAGMINFDRQNAVIGTNGKAMVAETDESDGSITLFHPDIAVLTNIAEDHKDMAELERLFATYLAQAKRCVVNAECPRAVTVAQPFRDKCVFYDSSMIPAPTTLLVPGIHNRSNAAAAVTAAGLLGISAPHALEALSRFQGVVSRLEHVGRTDSGITVIDDFAHNPDKIAASLATLAEARSAPGRLIVIYQPHGFAPLKRHGDALATAFAEGLGAQDILFLTEAFYAGGTTDQTVSARMIADRLKNDYGRDVRFVANKESALSALISEVRPDDIVCVMGARDEGLRLFARQIFHDLQKKAAA